MKGIQSNSIYSAIKYVLLIFFLININNIYAGIDVQHEDEIIATNHAKYKQSKQHNKGQYQNLTILKEKINQYLKVQSIGYPGEVLIHVGHIDERLKLLNCDDVKVNMPHGRRAWGKTSVVAGCEHPRWSIYVQAEVKVMADYLISSIPLAQGQMLDAKSVIFQKGDLTQLPAGIFTALNQIEGKLVSHSMMAGTVLRQDMLKLSPVIQQGQTVMLVTNGHGFNISAEGKAINKAVEGQVVQVKVSSGQLVSGIARQDGKVEVVF